VREPAEHAADTIAGSVNIPRGILEFQIEAVCDGREVAILLCCGSGGRAALAATALTQLGYSDVTSVTGSFVDLSRLRKKGG
jgi:rhodanese-related sulfurtransferase